MIIDTLQNLDCYAPLNRGFQKAFAFLHEAEISAPADGRYPIDGDDVYAIVTSYSTKDEETAKFESHKRFIDVQYMLSGKERIGYAPLGMPEISVPYDGDKDIILYNGVKQYVEFAPGMAAIFFPQDVHQPGVSAGAPSSVRKIVVKVRV